MGCALCNLISISEKEEPFPSESARQDFMHELAKDIARHHPDLVRSIEEAMVNQGDRPHLTKREIELLGLVAESKTNKEIGAALNISWATARNHIVHIMDKLGAVNRVHAVTLAREKYILPKESNNHEVHRLPVQKRAERAAPRRVPNSEVPEGGVG
jgi:DNA-binding CsgD family transcriptional regulator